MPIRTEIPERQLVMRVQDRARALGLTTASAMATHVGGPRQSHYNIWSGWVQTLKVTAYGRLCRGLSAPGTLLDSGDWFTWTADAEGVPQLIWNVRARAEALGLQRMAFGFRSQLDARSRDQIWDGTARAVFMDTLARIALALDTPEQPFDIGDLMAWVAPAGHQPIALLLQGVLA